MMESIGSALKGVYRDVLIEPDRGVVFDSGWNSNTIVKSCRILLAAFMRKEGSSLGIQHLAVGEGAVEWDEEIPSVDPESTGSLVKPASEKIELTDANFTYLDEDDGISESRSPRLQIKATLVPGFPVNDSYALREFGLFGSFDGAEDVMINCVRHPVIYKGPNATLLRKIRLYF